MKLSLVIISSFLSISAFAHVEPGTWLGHTADGTACSMESVSQYFENGEAHPLNERVQIKIGNDTFAVGHPPVIDAATATAFFNHDMFQGVLATDVGAKALIVKMVHTASFEGPSAFTLIDHDWTTNTHNKLECLEIKLQVPAPAAR